MEKSTQDRIKKLLQEIKDNSHKKIILYSLNGCPACEEYKSKTEKLGLVYETVEMSGNEKMWKKLSEMGGSEFVPQVQVEDYLIKEEEYDNVNELISKTLSNLLNKKVIIK